jgi:photosystem II stability/assembly factor-like uncharacterized protein
MTKRQLHETEFENIKGMNMKSNLLLVTLISLISFSKSFPQQNGWVNIGGNLPSSNGTITLPDLYFVNDNEGWICSGLTGEIYHTTNGGSTYTIQTTQNYTNAIHMLNSSEGYAGGLNGSVYRTNNGGETWNVIGSIGSSLRSISFPPSSVTGYCCGDNGKIYNITSTGVSSMGSGVTANLRSISFPSSSRGWTCGLALIINYNGSWSPQDPPSEGYNAIYMVNNTTGWSVGDNGVIVNTTDGGLNWNYQANPDTSNKALNDVFFLNASEGWAVGNSGVILHTTNGGTLWTIEGAGLTTNMLRAVQFTSPTNGYLLGNNGTLLKYTQLTGIENVEGQYQRSILQNQPNPFNQSTTISWYFPHTTGHSVSGDRVVLKVFDFMGKEVRTLVDAEMAPGEHQITFDASNLPAGVYFCQLHANGKVESKKMVYLK